MNPLSHEIEELKRVYYHKFYEKHKDLLENEPEEYHRQCRDYVDAKVYQAWVEEHIRKGK